MSSIIHLTQEKSSNKRVSIYDSAEFHIERMPVLNDSGFFLKTTEQQPQDFALFHFSK